MNCREIEDIAPLYLSGELSQNEQKMFEAHLSACRSCTAEIRQQVALDARIRGSFAADLPEGTALERTVRARVRRERVRRFAIGAVAAAALLVGAVLGYRALRPERLYLDAALDHRVEVMEHQQRRWRTDPADIEKAAQRYELSDAAALAGSLAPQGYRLEHAKVCGIDGKPALHLVYTDGNHEFSVYVRHAAGITKGNAIRTVSVGAEHLAGFRGNHLEAVIATTGTSGECLQWAKFAQAVL
jgi:anti-sigma factor RsiW